MHTISSILRLLPSFFFFFFFFFSPTKRKKKRVDKGDTWSHRGCPMCNNCINIYFLSPTHTNATWLCRSKRLQAGDGSPLWWSPSRNTRSYVQVSQYFITITSIYYLLCAQLLHLTVEIVASLHGCWPPPPRPGENVSIIFQKNLNHFNPTSPVGLNTSSVFRVIV